MIRPFSVLAALLALAACEAAPAAPPPIASAACHWRPDGGPPLADRGIGGTGALVDRGIGGTGIVGIVTGFASICIDGMEVAYDPGVPVEIDGHIATADALRVGQVVAIAAASAAMRIAVRYEVSGPVDSVGDGEPGLVVVAGQRVRLAQSAVGTADVKPGAWVVVSGIRTGDGDILASRIDNREPGAIALSGPLIEADGMRWIGALAIETTTVGGPGGGRPGGGGPGGGGKAGDLAGSYVTATGHYVDGVLKATKVEPDLLIANPPAYFGPGVSKITIASYARFSGSVVRINGGFEAPMALGFVPPANGRGLVAVTLKVEPNGTFAVVAAQPVAGLTASGVGPAASAGPKTSTHGGSTLSKPTLTKGAAGPGTTGGGTGKVTGVGGAAKGSVPKPAGAAAIKPAAVKVKK